METERLTLTIAETAHAIGISRANAYSLVEQGKLPAIRLGRRLIVPKAALLTMLDKASQSNQSTDGATPK
jgi:excisionase family DNA binding protein